MSKRFRQFLALDNFRRAWGKVAANQGCAGVDQQTIPQFAQQSSFFLKQLIQDLEQGAYHPMPLRPLWIPKKSGGWRSLAVSTVRDRIVQQALLQVLYPLLEPQFESCSFAYRPGRSHKLAVQQVDFWHRRGFEWLLNADVVDYFENVQHLRLLAEVQERLHEPKFLKLIEQWITAGILTSQGMVLPTRGVSQGAVISPILANVYLDDFDERLLKTRLKLVRFADDFVVMGRSEQQIITAKEQVAQLLGQMGLELHPEKTRITNFARGFQFLGHRFVGNLVVETSKEERAQAPKPKTHQASELPLVYADLPSEPNLIQQAMLEKIEELKAAHREIPPPLFVVLGYRVREEKPVAISSMECMWREGMATLYLVHQGSTLRKEQGRFVVEGEQAVEIPIVEVERILVLGHIQLTTAAIETCLEEQIPVTFCSQSGDYKGHLWSAEFCDLETEAAQFQRRQDEAFRFAVAQQVILGKLANARHLLLRLNRKRQLVEVSNGIEQLSQDLESVRGLEQKTDQAATLDQLRGHEGAAAVRYFTALGQLITHEGFSLTGRTRRPPKDPVNALLSFGYTLLYNNVLSLLLAEGLNPYLGNLHGSERKEAFLAFDLMEEFRSPIVDTLVMRLVNQKVLRPTDFTWFNPEGGVYLADTARRVFLKHFEERISSLITHPDVTQPVSYRRVIQLQIQRYKRTLLEGIPYESFRRVD
jgi:CRISPR-associated protein Cas1